MNESILRRPAVEGMTSLSRSSIYALMDRGEFPRPVRISKRAVGWYASEVRNWIATRPSSR
ncbi:DNA-binding protein [Sphingobium sp. SCG-1]|uniref:helix-turn-helix transcriptional regulator n=1 Tax=Sphingobium sp. SCG-1 TaxID=2072936 RepID=UPI000CD6C502|nr:AlpA family phage regulatory protein [Sphingobium sp. SCG-1]AUW57089.1 DNA-binding protein [Sphingobium sp. SCG-1]